MSIATPEITLSPIIFRYFRPFVEVWNNFFYFPLTAIEQKRVTLTLTHVTQRVESQIIGTLRDELHYLLLIILIAVFADNRFMSTFQVAQFFIQQPGKALKMCRSFIFIHQFIFFWGYFPHLEGGLLPQGSVKPLQQRRKTVVWDLNPRGKR
jgi:hypothetical protein